MKFVLISIRIPRLVRARLRALCAVIGASKGEILAAALTRYQATLPRRVRAGVDRLAARQQQQTEGRLAPAHA